jgi:hypothetical protein
MIGHASDGDGGHSATPRDAGDEGPSAILQVFRNGVLAVFGREDAMNAERNAGVVHVSGNLSRRERVLPSLRDSRSNSIPNPALTCRAGFCGAPRKIGTR